MKKMMLLGALLVCAAGVGHAQESRQDFSASFIGVYAPDVYGLVVLPMHTSNTGGVLGSYRYDLTPRSQLEANYGFAQNTIFYHSTPLPQAAVHTRMQEFSAAYVYTRSYRRWNPFLEGGLGGYMFTPILDYGTKVFDTKQQVRPGALFGGGVAYELSPSFDIRVQYRGFLMKTPDFGYPGGDLTSSRYYVLMTPALGVAYHF